MRGWLSRGNSDSVGAGRHDPGSCFLSPIRVKKDSLIPPARGDPDFVFGPDIGEAESPTESGMV